ncbi:MAG: vitamin B12-dependent ribonucleotide reductase [Chloroflexi bacterium]|nr:vitamin B12-dependent ribonucleotide reductase [Chloroflexota bacterium]
MTDTNIRSQSVHKQVEPAIAPNARVVLEKRYLLKDKEGKVIETPAQMFRRVAKALAEVDRIYDSNADLKATEEKFYRAMATLEFVPNSPTLMNAGTGAGTLSACFVLGLEDSMEGIMETAKEAALVQKFGGGTGFALSTIRPKGAPIATTHGKACGPIAVLRHLSSVSTLVTQGGKRDGANMAVMDVHHPDVLEFIDCKRVEGQIHNFNISVGADEEFMRAVERGEEYELRDPTTGEVVKRLNAHEVFEKIVSGAWLNGEPGLIFLDSVNRDNPVPNLGRMTATNPCGEQPLLPYESCNLGSINLAKFVEVEKGKAEIDYTGLGEMVRTTVHLLDNVIDANRYSIPEIERMTRLTRKIGLGVMGFADMLIQMRVPYDSEDGLEIGRAVMKFIREESDKASIKLAEKRDVFPAFGGSIYDRPGMPRIRNACRLTVAPTGTISMIADCSSGIEPLIALCYRKHNILEGQSLLYVNEAFERVAREDGFYSQELMEYLADGGSLQERDDVPKWVKQVFVTSQDISPQGHVRMQAVFQESVDAAISKTINFPNEATVDDVKEAYLLAWKLGCKGITVYRAGSREKEIFVRGSKEKDSAEQETKAQELLVPRQRPTVVKGTTERVRTGHGNLYITVNYDDEGYPFEVFTTLGKAGGCDSAQLEAISRLISLALRSGLDPVQIVDQLRGITCCPVWDNGVMIRSTPDAVSQALGRIIKEPPQVGAGPLDTSHPQINGAQLGLFSSEERNGHKIPTGARCPDCSGLLAHQEGCLRCLDCGYNRCE